MTIPTMKIATNNSITVIARRAEGPLVIATTVRSGLQRTLANQE
jgi:hypothetical protein